MSCWSISTASRCERCVTSVAAAAAADVASDAMARVREGDRAANRAAKKARARRGGGGGGGRCGLGFWAVGVAEGAAAVGAGKVERKNGIPRVVVVVAARPDLVQILDAAVSIPRLRWRGRTGLRLRQ